MNQEERNRYMLNIDEYIGHKDHDIVLHSMHETGDGGYWVYQCRSCNTYTSVPTRS